MSYILFFSFSLPPLRSRDESSWAPRFYGLLWYKRVVSLQWALLWRILGIRSKPVTRSRGSEEGRSGFSWCVLDHWKNSHHSNVTHLRDPSVKAETWASCHQKRMKLFTVALGGDGEPSHLADHKPSGLPPLKISSVTEHHLRFE